MDAGYTGTAHALRLAQCSHGAAGPSAVPSGRLATRGAPLAAQPAAGATAAQGPAEPRAPHAPGQRAHRAARQLLRQHAQVSIEYGSNGQSCCGGGREVARVAENNGWV